MPSGLGRKMCTLSEDLAAALTNAAGVWRGLVSHRLSHPVLRIALHTAPFRGSAIVPTILSFLSRALKRPSTLIYEGIPQVGLFLIHCAECEHQSTLSAFCNLWAAQFLPSWSESPRLSWSTLLGTLRSDPLNKPIIVSCVCL
jgi:hypothetical protein